MTEQHRVTILHAVKGDQIILVDRKGNPMSLYIADDQNTLDEYRLQETAETANHVHIAFGDNIQGRGLSSSDVSKPYIGVYVDSSNEDSNDPTRYHWSKR